MNEFVQLCVLRVGAEDYAIDLKRIDEILHVPPLTRVPQAPAFLEGVATLRGEVLPVLDVRRRLGVEPSAAAGDLRARRRERLLVCKVGRRRVGLVVDAVSQVMRKPTAEFRPAPLTQTPGRAPHVLGVVGHEGRLVLLLDVKALLVEGRA